MPSSETVCAVLSVGLDKKIIRMSVKKTPVTTLQEYCQKKDAPLPHYTISDFKNKLDLFTCIVRAFDQEADGVGTNRQVAKHDAASNMLKKLEKLHSDLGNINVLHQSITSDSKKALINFCMEHKHPYPSVEITEQSGTPDSPIFTALCRVGSIAAEAIGATKSCAKQLASEKVLNIIKNLAPPKDVMESIIDIDKRIADKKQSIKDYRRAISSADMALQNRHNYFKEMHPDIKEAIWKILDDCTIQSTQVRAELVLKTIGIKYKISNVQTKHRTLLPFIELLCDLDVVFVNTYDKIFCDIINYFRDMLN